MAAASAQKSVGRQRATHPRVHALGAGDQPYSMLMVSMTDFIAALTISVSGSRTMT